MFRSAWWSIKKSNWLPGKNLIDHSKVRGSIRTAKISSKRIRLLE